ncbi:predicted protein [Arabidopsis lyrata subsp. lyrata]|uniref:Predicted protein n=1 Tax=Arabidopsis lyrata subsp. lyrata TaxID=81972 RepID=D7LCP5_ARALL|nr:predicted protein [Arabidopsis lyrata subsp. lyrata]
MSNANEGSSSSRRRKNVNNKIDTLKGNYKEWVDLMDKIGLSSDSRTGVIRMDDDWWQLREAHVENCMKKIKELILVVVLMRMVMLITRFLKLMTKILMRMQHPKHIGSSGGSVRSSGSSVGYSSGNSLGHSSENSEYRFAKFPQFQPSPAMGQFFSSPGQGFNMPGQMVGVPYVPMMFPQGFGGYPFIALSPATQMLQTSGSPGVFNVGASSSMG